VQEAYLFGSYAKGEARTGSDVDIAIRASAVDWTFRTAKWEQYLTKAIGVQVNIRTLALPNVRRYCQEFSVPLKLE
jgi:predicted nucleotidyltransferase